VGARKGKAVAAKDGGVPEVPVPEVKPIKGTVPTKGAAGGAAAGAAAGKAGGREGGAAPKSDFMDGMFEASNSARVDVDTNDLIDIGELDDINGLHDDEIEGFFSPSAGGGKGGEGGLGDFGDFGDLSFGDLDGNFDGCFASTPQAADPGTELNRQDSLVSHTHMSLACDPPLPYTASLPADLPPVAHNAVEVEATRKAQAAKDLEILSKPMTQLPPVARRPAIVRRGHKSGIPSGMQHGVPSYYLSLSYGPSAVALTSALTGALNLPLSDTSKDAPVVIDETQHVKEFGSNRDVGAAGSGGESSVVGGPSTHMLQSSNMQKTPAHRAAAVQHHSQAWQAESTHLVDKRGEETSRHSVLQLYSVNKVWDSSESVCVHAKCSRAWLLLAGHNGLQRMQHGVAKLLPLEHLMVHQMALTCFDMPVRAPMCASNAPPAPMSMQSVRNAMVLRTHLIKEGVSAAAHLSLEHMLRGEVGDDAHVMMALDPLSLPADPTSVAYSIARVLGALDTLLPGMPRQMTLLDLPSLLGCSGGDVQHLSERLAPPAVLVGDADKNWIEVPPAALRWWEKLPLEPYGNKKNVVYCVICGSGTGPQTPPTASETEASLFFKELSCMYQAANLGTHRQLDTKLLLPMDDLSKTGRVSPVLQPNGGVLLKDAIISVKPVKSAPVPLPNAQRPLPPFEEACIRALRGLVKIDGEMPTPGGALPVLYILEPDFAEGNSWSGAQRMHDAYPSPAKMRADWQRSLAKEVANMALSCPRILDLVVQIVPAHRINIGRKMHWLLRDLAMAVYDKGRLRQRMILQSDTGFVEIDDQTHTFFSAATMTVKRKIRVDRKLHEPLLIVTQPHSAHVPAPPRDAASTAKATSSTDKAPMLHCCYAWSDDGLCLGAAVTDSTGQMLETFTSFFAPSEVRTGAPASEPPRHATWRFMMQRLWNSIYDWMRMCYARPVRLVIGSLGAGPDVARDVATWRAILEKARCGAGDHVCCEALLLGMGVLRSLQLLSRSCPT